MFSFYFVYPIGGYRHEENEGPMSSRTTLRKILASAVISLVTALPGSIGLNETLAAEGPESSLGSDLRKPTTPVSPPESVVGRQAHGEDERAIRAVDEAFVRDYNRGDSKGVADVFTEDAEILDPSAPAIAGGA